MQFTSTGIAALEGAEDVEREGHRRPRVEVGDDEVVDREREGEHRAAEDAGQDQRQGDQAEGFARGRAEVLRRLLQPSVEADQPRAHDDHDEADAEHDVGDQQRAEPERGAEDEEEGEQRGAHHDLRRRHRDHDQEVRRPPAEELVADQGERHHRADRSVEITVASSASLIEVTEGFVQFRDPEDVVPVLEGEADPGEVVATGRVVEGEEEDDRDRDQHVEDHQHADDQHRVLAQPFADAHAAGGAALVAGVALISPPPPRPSAPPIRRSGCRSGR